MRTVVTGAAGFIGSTLVDVLVSHGHDVVGIDNLTTGNVGNLEVALERASRTGTFRLEPMDVRSPDLGELFSAVDPDVIFHLAAQVDIRASVADPASDALDNVLGTVNLCEAARNAGVRRLVYAASGGSRYGTPDHLPVTESAPLAPLSPYAVSKLAGELYLGAYRGMYGIAPISLALSNVFGPRQNPHGEAGVIAIFCSALLRGFGVTIYGDGTATRDYVYVDDVVDAFIRAGDAPLSVTGTFNIGTGRQTSVDEVYRVISDAVGHSAPAVYKPFRTGELEAIALDSADAMTELGWRPTVGITEGIQRTVDWLRETPRLMPALRLF